MTSQAVFDSAFRDHPLRLRHSYPTSDSSRDQRITSLAAALTAGLKEKKKLSIEAAGKIAAFVEDRFANPPRATQPRDAHAQVEYFSTNTTHLQRALLLDHTNRQFFVLSKQYGRDWAEGAERIFSIATLFSFKDTCIAYKEYAHLSNIDSKDVASIIKQAELSEEIYQDIFMIHQHTTEGEKQKISIIEELYETNLQKALKLKDRLLTTSQIASIFAQVAKTVLFLHNNGYIHGDINVSNILIKNLTQEAVVAKLTDFGWTYHLDDDDDEDRQKRTTESYGSIPFSAPEWFGAAASLQDPVSQGKADDLFALGCSLYLALFPAHLLLPWHHEVDKAIAHPSDETKSLAKNKYLTTIETLQRAIVTEVLSERKALLTTCLNLLSLDPQVRISFQELSDLIK